MYRSRCTALIGVESYGKRATRGFAWNHLYKLSEFGLLNIYTMLIARHFGPVDSTPFVVYAAAGTSLSLIGAVAVDGVLLRYIPRLAEGGEHAGGWNIEGVRDFPTFIRKLFAFRLFVILILIAVLLVLFFILIANSVDTSGSISRLIPPVSVFLFAQAIIAFATFSLIALMRTKFIFTSSIVARGLLVLMLIAMMATSGLSIDTAIAIHLASAILNAGLLLYFFNNALKNIDQGSPHPKPLGGIGREIFGFVRRPRSIKALLVTPVMLYGLVTWGNDLLSLILGRQSDILMLRGILGEQTPEVGYYNVASLILLFTEYIFLFGLGTTLIGVFSKLAYDDERASGTSSTVYAGLNRGRREVASFQAVMLIPLCTFMMIFPLEVLRAIYGPLYDAGAPMVQHGIIALVINITLFHGGLQITSLVAIGKQQLVLKNRICWAVINIIANYFLIRSYGAVGAIIGTNWANTMACATEWYFAKKYIGDTGNLLSFLRIAVISAVSAGIVYSMMQLITLELGLIAEAVVPALVFAVLISTLFYLFRIPETTIILSRLKKAFAS